MRFFHAHIIIIFKVHKFYEEEKNVDWPIDKHWKIYVHKYLRPLAHHNFFYCCCISLTFIHKLFLSRISYKIDFIAQMCLYSTSVIIAVNSWVNIYLMKMNIDVISYSRSHQIKIRTEKGMKFPIKWREQHRSGARKHVS